MEIFHNKKIQFENFLLCLEIKQLLISPLSIPTKIRIEEKNYSNMEIDLKMEILLSIHFVITLLLLLLLLLLTN